MPTPSNRCAIAKARLLPMATVMLLCAGVAAAQCDPQWQPGHPLAGTTDSVRASVTWDPDGAGPAPAVLVVAGLFEFAGAGPAHHVAQWDPTTNQWTPLGSGTDRLVLCLHVTGSGDLIAGGAFANAGGVACAGIARWDGSAWLPLGAGIAGVDPVVRAITELPGGDLLVAATFAVSSGLPPRIDRYDGVGWTAAATANGAIEALCVRPNGDLIAGGSFTQIGGVAADRLARFDGAGWSQVEGGFFLGAVLALANLPNGDMVIGGSFLPFLCTWRAPGLGFSFFPTQVNSTVHCIEVLPSGAMYIGGQMTYAGPIPTNYLAFWNGTDWQGAYDADAFVRTLTTLPNGDLVAGGEFSRMQNTRALHVARLDANGWHALGDGIDAAAHAVLPLANGDTAVAGAFTTVGGVAASAVARWNGTTYAALGGGIVGTVEALAELPGGDLIAAGTFQTAGGVAAANIARWDGVTWSPLGGGVDDTVHALLALPDGRLVAAGRFQTAGGTPCGRIAVWDGAAWSPFGTGLANPVGGIGQPRAEALCLLPSGEFVVGGSFQTAGGVPVNHLARWDGTGWQSVGGGRPAAVRALAVSGGDLLVASISTFLGAHVTRWNGSAWTPVGTGPSEAPGSLAVLPGGDVLAGGAFALPDGSRGLMRFSGATWTAVDGGTDDLVRDVAVARDGSIVVVGEFAILDGLVSAGIARLASPCPATAVRFGIGCAGSAGPLSLTADSLPWLGATFASTTSGFAPGTIAVWQLGLSTANAPLSLLHPAAGPGCTQWIDPDLLSYLLPLPTGGAASAGVFVPNDPAFVGLVFHHTVAAVEFSPALAITRIAATDALTLAIGSY
ncbi:MAG: WD40 repeat domain-containing protein [Planctomycetota bacterium]